MHYSHLMTTEKNTAGIAADKPFRWVSLLLQVVMATLFTLLVWHCVLVSLIEAQKTNNEQLKKLIVQRKNTALQVEERQQTMDDYETRLRFIANLRDQNIKAAQSMRELDRVLLPAIQVQRIQRQDNTLLIDGVASSRPALVQWMGVIAHSAVFLQPVLTTLSQSANRDQFNFQLKLSLRL